MSNYHTTDQHIHQLIQIIAKANRTYVSKKDDDSHTNLYFDPVSNRLLGRWIKANDQDIILTLQLDDFQFAWLDKQLNPIYTYSIQGQTLEQIEQAIETDLPNLGLDKADFRTPLHFEITEYDFVQAPFTGFSKHDLKEWVTYRQLANEACQHFLGHLQIEGEIRIWPHHFDTGTYVVPSTKVGFGFGMAMQDSMVGEPYFYYAAYPMGDHSIAYEQLPALEVGQWKITAHWKGAVLPFSNLTSKANEQVQSFIKTVSRSYLTQ